MQMKRLLLATVAVAAVAGAQQAQADGMYVSVFGGANWYDDISGRLATTPGDFLDVNADPDTGFVLGGAIGAGLDRWVSGLNAEIEVSYRRQDVEGTFFSTLGGGHTHTGLVVGNQSTFAIMANAWYEIDAGWKVKPYLGGGVGWARASWEVALPSSSGLDSFQDENSGFAWQLGLGFNYEVAQGVDVGLGYRYFDGPNNDGQFVGNHQTYSKTLENENHSVLVNLTIETN